MRTVLIDDAGRLVDAASPQLRSDLHAWTLGEGLADYAVRNLGFIELGGRAHAPHVRLRPHTVSPVALAALIYWISDKAPERLALSIYDGGWRHELIGDRARISRRLSKLASSQSRSRDGDFRRRAADPAHLPCDNALARLIALQAEFAHWLTPERMQPFLDGSLGGRFCETTACPDLDRIVVARLGSGFAIEAAPWLERSIGHRLEDQPDEAYGAWLAETYRDVLRSATPQLDDVDVIVSWPNQGRQRYCYKRLLVPLQADKTGNRRVLTATLQDRRIDLRLGVEAL